MPAPSISSSLSTDVPVVPVVKPQTAPVIAAVIDTPVPPTVKPVVVAKPGTTKVTNAITDIHSFRIFDIAVIDVAATVLSAYLIAKFFPIKKLHFNTNFLVVLLVLLVLGVAAHRYFKVRTTIDKLLFPNA
jgi:hypothetical protein